MLFPRSRETGGWITRAPLEDASDVPETEVAGRRRPDSTSSSDGAEAGREPYPFLLFIAAVCDTITKLFVGRGADF